MRAPAVSATSGSEAYGFSPCVASTFARPSLPWPGSTTSPFMKLGMFPPSFSSVVCVPSSPTSAPAAVRPVRSSARKTPYQAMAIPGVERNELTDRLLHTVQEEEDTQRVVHHLLDLVARCGVLG